MMKIVQITDLHLLPPGGRLKDVLDPEPRLRECLADIEALHGDAEALVVTGDLTENGEPEAYELLKRILADYRLPPTYLTIGNHDERKRFGEVFPGSADPQSGFAHQSFPLGDHLGILIDTWEFGTHAGSLCADRLAWLTETLSSDPRPALLFMHHAPFKVGMKRLDQIILGNEDGLFETLQPFRNRIRHMFFGHMHRSVSGSWRGFPFTVVPGTGFHGMLDFKTDLIRAAIIEPYYSVILLDGENLIVHPKQVSKTWTVIESVPGKPPAHAA